MDTRPDWDDYFMDIATLVSSRSTCMRRQVGCVVVKDRRILSTGYNGAPRGRQNCLDRRVCLRDELGIPSFERYELCRSVHAEANAIISAARRDMIGATLFLAGRNAKTGELLDDTTPCFMCRRMIINSGIVRTICRISEDNYSVTNTRDWVFNDDSLNAVP